MSTDHQSVRNQEIELQAVAERHVSGAKGREKRPGLDKLLQAVARKEFDMVAAWSVDRLGRSLIDLVGILQEFHAKHVDLYLHQQGIDTTTPSGKAMFQMMGVFAEFERSMIHERVHGRARPGKGRRNAARATGNRRGRRSQGPNNPSRPRGRQEHPDHCTRAGGGHWDGFAPYGIERRPRENNSTISAVYRGTRARQPAPWRPPIEPAPADP